MTNVASYVDRLNVKLRDRFGEHIQVGHSYFMQDDLDEALLHQIWRADILPFLEDQLFGKEEELDEYTLQAIKQPPQIPPAPAFTRSSSPSQGAKIDADAEPDGA